MAASAERFPAFETSSPILRVITRSTLALPLVRGSGFDPPTPGSTKAGTGFEPGPLAERNQELMSNQMNDFD